MADMINKLSLTGLAASLAGAMGVEVPAQAEASLRSLDQMVQRETKSGRVDRIFMYNPDAVALWLYQKYTDMFEPVLRHTSLALPLCSVMPSVTPVCFGTMYTGAQPAVHGIRRYEKPVIRIDTLFDAMIRAGKKVALVVDDECSMGKIFCEREMDYFYCENEDAINAKAMDLIEQDVYDMICVYNGNYDSTMHKNGPEGEASMAALTHNTAAFEKFALAIEEKWSGHDTLLAFAMDHGCHEIDGNCGSHGLDMPEDLNIIHFYGVKGRK